MMRFASRRLAGLILLGVLALGAWWLDRVLRVQLRPAALISGGALLALVVVLASFNARKKLPFLPLFSAAVWMQTHIYGGLLAAFAYFLHAGFRLPSGPLEVTVAVLFWLVTLSGVLGLILSRIAPARLTLRGGNVTYEQIPALREGLRREVEDLVVRSLPETRSSTLADFYQQRLREHFAGPRNFWSHAWGNQKPLHRLLARIRDVDRYLNAAEREFMARIAEQVRRKDDLDAQQATQTLLRGWLFAHIPLSLALLIFALVHGLLAWMF